MVMRSSWFMAVVIVVCLNYINAEEACKNPQGKFDCNGRGKHVAFQDGRYCRYRCQDGDQLLTCEEVHPPPNSPEYENSECSPKDRVGVFNCDDNGIPFWQGCNFDCRADDMILNCEQVYGLANN